MRRRMAERDLDVCLISTPEVLTRAPRDLLVR